MIKNDEIEVSFVVTIFNKEKFIKNMVNSLKSQEGLFSREYVFVNDGSTDRSMAILKEETKNLDNCHIISQKNSGPSNATNNGVKSSHGKWIKIVDADDVLLKKSTKFLLHLLNKYNLDGLYGKQYKRIENDKINGISCNYNNNIDIKRIKITDIAKKGLAGSSQIIFKRDIFLKSDGCYENVFC